MDSESKPNYYFELKGYNAVTMQVLSKSSGAIVVEELTELPEGITLQTYTDSQRIAFNSTFNNYAKKEKKAPLHWRKEGFPRDLTEQTPNTL